MRDGLRRIHPASTAKLVARDLSAHSARSVSQRTVENWLLLISTPSLEHFALMAQAYGPAFVVGVLPVLAALAPAVEACSSAGYRERTAALRHRQDRARASLRGGA